MSKHKSLNTILVGLLALGGADLIWLNGWLVPALLADSADETNSQHEHAIDDPSHQSKPTPDSIVYNESSPKSQSNALNEPSMGSSDKIVVQSLDEERAVIVDTVKVAEAAIVSDTVKADETTIVSGTVKVAAAAVVNDTVKVAETADKLAETTKVVPIHTETLSSQHKATSADFTILFPTDSYALSKFNRRRIRTISKAIKDTKSRVQLTGHADKRGNTPYNEVLATRRAESVARRLQLLGVSAEKIDSKTMGERAPLANATLRRQRRVEIHLLKRE